MINIANIAQTMQNLLNDNTFDTRFKVFYWINNVDFRFEDFGDGDENYVPAVIISTNGQTRPIPSLRIVDQTFTLQIYFPMSQQNEVLENLSQFANKIVGQTISISGKRCVFNMDVPNLSEVKSEHIGVLNSSDPRLKLKTTEYYGVVQVRVYFVESSLMYGNDVRYFLRVKGGTTPFEELKKYDSSSSNNKITSTEHLLTQQTSESVAQMNSFNNNITFYFEQNSTMQLDIVRNAELGINQNQVYVLRIQYGTLTYLTFEKEVIVENVSIAQSLGNVIMLSINFKKASVIL